MNLRTYALVTSLALAGCGGGGGGGGSSTTGGGGGGGTPVPAPASTTRIVVAPTSPQELQDLCDQKGAKIVTDIPGTDYYLVEVPDGQEVEGFRGEVEHEGSVEDAELDEGVGGPEGGAGGGGIGGGGSTIPAFGDDPLSAVAVQTGVSRTGALMARARGHRGAGVVVAVIDTGISPTHPLVKDHLLPGGYDFVDEDADPTDEPNGLDDNGDGRIDEGVGHGTFVASLVLAMAPDAKILVLRALDSDGVGTASGVARAIAYAIEHGADVINLSAGLSTELRLLQQAAQNAKSNGVPLYAAAGNRSSTVDFPAAFSEAKAVTALDGFDRKPAFASFGSPIDLVAPGVDLVGAHPLSPSGTARWSGTSFSTALVTGGFAVLRGADATSSNLDVAKRLEDTATSVDLVNPTFAGKLGRGRIDVDRATR